MMLAMIRKLKSGRYRLYSRKKDPRTGRRRNLGTFPTRTAALKHERAIQLFKRHPRYVLKSLGWAPRHLGGDRFKAPPRRDIPESKKPTPAQKRAWARNIKKAQAARRAG